MQPQTQENRRNPRWRVYCPVVIRSRDYGEYPALGINISAGGIFIQTFDPLPLGTEIDVLIGHPGGILARGVVRSHYYMTYREGGHPAACTGMGIRFTGFEDASVPSDAGGDHPLLH